MPQKSLLFSFILIQFLCLLSYPEIQKIETEMMHLQTHWVIENRLASPANKHQ